MGRTSSWLAARLSMAVLKQEREREHDPEHRADTETSQTHSCVPMVPRLVPGHQTFWDTSSKPPPELGGGVPIPSRPGRGWPSQGAGLVVWGSQRSPSYGLGVSLGEHGAWTPGEASQLREDREAGVGAPQTEAAQDSQLHPHQSWDCGRATGSSCTPASPSAKRGHQEHRARRMMRNTYVNVSKAPRTEPGT